MCTSAPGSLARTPAHSGTRVPVRPLALLVGIVLGGCAVGPNYVRPESPPVAQYGWGGDPAGTKEAHGVAQRFAPGGEVERDWWRLFHSAPLDAAVAEALARNPGLAAAQASLQASEESLRSGYGIFFPQAQADARASRERFSAVQFGQPSAGGVFDLFTLGASVSYALDVFGGERRMIEGLRAQVDAQHATEEAAYLTLVANVVNTLVAAAAYRAEIEATGQLIELQKSQVKLAQVQWQAGTVAYSSVLALRRQLASYQATIPQLEQKLTQSEDLLASLTGHVPAEWPAPQLRLSDLSLPAELPVSLPSRLVRQRPDVLLAEATAHSASAQIGVATAAMLPSITLNGAYSASSVQAGELFAPQGRAWSFGADVTAPLFQGGTLWHRRKAAVDTYHETAALYRQTVLGAFAQVADTLRALDHDARALAAEDEALATAEQALHLIQIHYEAGLSTYLEVLAADAQYHQAMIGELEALAVRYQDTVALYVALGGGWWHDSD